LLSALDFATAAASATSAAAAGSFFSTATAAPLPMVVIMIAFVVTAAVVIIVIKVIVPVAAVDNDAMPGPRRSLCCQSLLSWLSNVSSNATDGVSANGRLLLPPLMRSLFPRLLSLTSCYGHDLLLRKSLF
jgi:hypothetical protein